MILGRPWMKKHGILLDMINNSITFSPGYCTHLGAPLFPIPLKPEGMETIPEARQQDIFPNHILKRGSDENLDDFLRIPQKISNKKRRLINASKRKQSMDKRKPETIVISSLDNSGIEGLPIPTQVSTLGTNKVDVAMIGADAYRAACKLKGAQVFAVSMRDLEYQAEKEAKPETNPRSVVPEEYHDLLDIFSKKNSDTLPPHRKYDHKIILEKQQKPGYVPLYKISPQELDAVKRCFDSNLAKGFIQISSALYSSPVLFVKKPDRGIQFCVDYWRLNAITKKDRYLIPLIEKTLAQLEGAKYFIKIDIRQTFYRIRMSKNSEELITFLTRFGAFKYLVMPFGLCNGPTSWQNLINDTLFDFLHRFVQASLDDILVYSKMLKNHRLHVRQV